MIRRPPRSTHCISSAASDVYKRQVQHLILKIMKKLVLFVAFALIACIGANAQGTAKKAEVKKEATTAVKAQKKAVKEEMKTDMKGVKADMKDVKKGAKSEMKGTKESAKSDMKAAKKGAKSEMKAIEKGKKPTLKPEKKDIKPVTKPEKKQISQFYLSFIVIFCTAVKRYKANYNLNFSLSFIKKIRSQPIANKQ
eukprot:TRINITY_DN1274_c0_g1_i1.p1 TRINITY_DN1274_c0_g1~~TRINITY_DN1274_c0_g1_i1.p1  ORF type:complete len:196 (+),score=50.10 TRINITY_DN1274_c0_g1_i1:136-723(+)